jgi:uncharacterized protein (DUF952 family)
MASNTFLHLTTKQAWVDALKVGTYSLSTKGKTLEEVGFIHGSFADQVEEVASFVFAGSTEDLVLLHLEIDKLRNRTASWCGLKRPATESRIRIYMVRFLAN